MKPRQNGVRNNHSKSTSSTRNENPTKLPPIKTNNSEDGDITYPLTPTSKTACLRTGILEEDLKPKTYEDFNCKSKELQDSNYETYLKYRKQNMNLIQKEKEIMKSETRKKNSQSVNQNSTHSKNGAQEYTEEEMHDIMKLKRTKLNELDQIRKREQYKLLLEEKEKRRVEKLNQVQKEREEKIKEQEMKFQANKNRVDELNEKDEIKRMELKKIYEDKLNSKIFELEKKRNEERLKLQQLGYERTVEHDEKERQREREFDEYRNKLLEEYNQKIVDMYERENKLQQEKEKKSEEKQKESNDKQSMANENVNKQTQEKQKKAELSSQKRSEKLNEINRKEESKMEERLKQQEEKKRNDMERRQKYLENMEMQKKKKDEIFQKRFKEYQENLKQLQQKKKEDTLVQKKKSEYQRDINLKRLQRLERAEEYKHELILKQLEEKEQYLQMKKEEQLREQEKIRQTRMKVQKTINSLSDKVQNMDSVDGIDRCEKELDKLFSQFPAASTRHSKI